MYIKFVFTTNAAGHYQLVDGDEGLELIKGEFPAHLPKNTITPRGKRDFLWVEIPGKDCDVTVEKILALPFLKEFLAEPKAVSPPGGAPLQEDRLALRIKAQLAKLVPPQSQEAKDKDDVDILQFKENLLCKKLAAEKDCAEGAKLRLKFLKDPFVFQQACALDRWSEKLVRITIDTNFEYDSTYDSRCTSEIDEVCPPGERSYYDHIQRTIYQDYYDRMQAYEVLAKKGLKGMSRENLLLIQQDKLFYNQYRSEIDARLAENAPGTIKSPPSTPLMQAAYQGDLARLQTLLAAGAPVNERHEGKGATALHHAVSSDEYKDEATRVKVIQALLEHKADLEAKDRFDYTPLMRSHSPAVAQFLLTQGAKPLSQLELCDFILSNEWKDPKSGSALACFFIDQNHCIPRFFDTVLYSLPQKGDQRAEVYKKLLSLYVPLEKRITSNSDLLDRAFLTGSSGILMMEAVSFLLPTYQFSIDNGRKNKFPNFVNALCNQMGRSSSPETIILNCDAFVRTLKALVEHPFFNEDTLQDALQIAQKGVDKGAVRAALVAAQEGVASTHVKINVQDIVYDHLQLVRHQKELLVASRPIGPTSISDHLQERDESKRGAPVPAAAVVSQSAPDAPRALFS